MTELADLTLAQNPAMPHPDEGPIHHCQELTQAYLDRIARLEPSLHAFITLAGEKALEAAQLGGSSLAANRCGTKTSLSPAHHALPIAD
jgi:Asp-tRNA(Asn)/Glu-tRNA(Gln) amidotransferase A subunit family amidase